MSTGPQHSTSRPQGREHIPLYPAGFIAIRIVQLVLAVIVMALSAFSIHFWSWDGNALILAVAVMTLVASVYHLVAWFGAPAAFNYWAILGLDIFFVVMWVCAFALQAARVAPLFEYTGGYTYNYRTGRYTAVGLSDLELAWLATQAAAAALGGVEFILFIVSLVIHSIRLHRHRAAGLHCMPGMPPTPPGAPTEKTAAGLPAPVYQHYPGHAYAYPQPCAPVHPGAAPAPAYQQQPQQFYPTQQQQQQQQQQPGFPPAQGGPGYSMPDQHPHPHPQPQPAQGYYAPSPSSPPSAATPVSGGPPPAPPPPPPAAAATTAAGAPASAPATATNVPQPSHSPAPNQ